MSRSNLGMFMAMSLMLAGTSVFADPGMSLTRRGSVRKGRGDDWDRKLTPEEEIVLKEKNVDQFKLDIVSHNVDRGERFKKWKNYEVQGIGIVSSNFKNAYKTFSFLLKKNNLKEGDI
jgi:hypothetical protein